MRYQRLLSQLLAGMLLLAAGTKTTLARAPLCLDSGGANPPAAPFSRSEAEVSQVSLSSDPRPADAVTRAGYIAIHPDTRDCPTSDDGDNFFRTGFAADGLKLIAILKEQAGPPRSLERADPSVIGLLGGHGMGGGGAVIRVVMIGHDILSHRLLGLRKQVTCHLYPGQLHTFSGKDDRLFTWRVVSFSIGAGSALSINS